MNVYMYALDCLWARICELRCLESQKRALESLELEVFCKLLTAESVPTVYKQMLFLLCFNYVERCEHVCVNAGITGLQDTKI